MTESATTNLGGPAHATPARNIAPATVEGDDAAPRVEVCEPRPRPDSADRAASASGCKVAVVGLQIGSINTAALPSLARHVAEHRPDRLLLIVGQSTRGTRRNMGRTVSDGVDEALAALRETQQGPIDLQISAEASISRDANRLRSRGVQLLPHSFEVAPGWVSTLAGPTTSDCYPGLAAMDLARQTGRCVILGGAHLPGMVGETTAAPDGTHQTLWGLEVISLPAPPSYRSQKLVAGIGILTINPTGPVKPTLIPIPTGVRPRTATGRTGPHAAVEQSSNHDNQRSRDHA